MLKKNFPVAITLDVDWAPDFVVAECADILRKFGVPATFFATHQSSLLKEIERDKDFEVGIHPNFLPGTTHGNNHTEIMDTMMDLVPKAKSIRTHGLFQTSNLFHLLQCQYSQICYDFSLFLPGNNHLKPFNFQVEKGRRLTRVPYQWEDDLYWISPTNKIIFNEATYQIFDFHPIHVYLNSPNSDNYNKMKRSINKPLQNANQKDLKEFKNSYIGAKTWLLEILESVPRERFFLASHIPEHLSL